MKYQCSHKIIIMKQLTSKAEIHLSIEKGLKQAELIRKGKLPKKKIEYLLREL